MRLGLFVPTIALIISSTAFSQPNGSIKKVALTVYKTEFGDNGAAGTKATPDGKVKVKGSAKEVYQVKTGLEFSSPVNDGKLNVQISFPTYDGRSKSYYWGSTVDSVDFSISMNNGAHKYFWFRNLGNGAAALYIEYPAPGASKFSDYLLKTIYFGNNVDMSTSVNGYLPSQLSLKDLFKPDTIWMHDSGFGQEAYRVIAMPGLDKQFQSALEVTSFMDDHFRAADKMDMKQISKTANNRAVRAKIKSLANWAMNVDIVNSPIYSASVEIEKELYSKNH
jgi:hypothetical protein